MNSRDLQACSEAVREAEKQVQATLINLVNRLNELTGNDNTIDSVRVDTRNFANLAVEIFTASA